jgi:flavin-dependent dehydrogenase
MAEIAIVGGGPSGSMCGEQLSRAGHSVKLFDEHLAWEKPCGGGLTHKAIQRFPFLLENNYPKKLIHSIDLIASNEQRATLDMPHPIVIYSRTVLNGMLLDRARHAGCSIQRSHVVSVDTTSEKTPLLRRRRMAYRRFPGPRRRRPQPDLSGNPPSQKRRTRNHPGLFIPQAEDSIIIKFLPHFDGYIWSFPRCDHLSVGICGSMASHNQSELRRHLQVFIGKQKFAMDGARFYSHVLPSPQVPTLSQRTVVGKNWALVGDAAAFVDPLTGEGLFYAMRSGELLGKAIADGNPQMYTDWVRAAFSCELEFACPYRSPLLSRHVPGHRRHYPHGPVPAPQLHFPPDHGRHFLAAHRTTPPSSSASSATSA